MIAPPPLADESRRLTTLHDLKILDTPPEERFDRLTRLAQRLFDVPVAQISLIDADRQWFKSSTDGPAAPTSREASFCGHAIASDNLLVVPDARLDRRFHDNPFVVGDPYVRFYAGCPISTSNGSRIGTLCLLDWKSREFSAQDAKLLSDLGHMVEQELDATQPADIDALTGIPNRRAFAARAQDDLDRCRLREWPATMLFFDLDGFKGINDGYGHGEGDRVLTVFASLLQDTVRDGGILGRLGGDEFVALLANCSEANADAAVQRLQASLDHHNRAAPRGYDIRFSAGRATADGSRRCSVEALVAEADARMYDCKRSHRAAAPAG
jgi:diguanylate cyclase (GGDEF)-like protein